MPPTPWYPAQHAQSGWSPMAAIPPQAPPPMMAPRPAPAFPALVNPGMNAAAFGGDGSAPSRQTMSGLAERSYGAPFPQLPPPSLPPIGGDYRMVPGSAGDNWEQAGEILDAKYAPAIDRAYQRGEDDLRFAENGLRQQLVRRASDDMSPAPQRKEFPQLRGLTLGEDREFAMAVEKARQDSELRASLAEREALARAGATGRVAEQFEAPYREIDAQAEKKIADVLADPRVQAMPPAARDALISKIRARANEMKKERARTHAPAYGRDPRSMFPEDMSPGVLQEERRQGMGMGELDGQRWAR